MVFLYPRLDMKSKPDACALSGAAEPLLASAEEEREEGWEAVYPGRHSLLACPGLLSCRPYGLSAFASQSWFGTVGKAVWPSLEEPLPRLPLPNRTLQTRSVCGPVKEASLTGPMSPATDSLGLKRWIKSTCGCLKRSRLVKSQHPLR